MEGIEPGDDAWPQQKPRRRQDPEKARGNIDVENIICKLQAIVDDDDESTANRLSAAKTLLDKSLSTLSSVDSTVRNEVDLQDEETLKARLRALIEAMGPELVSQALKGKAA